MAKKTLLTPAILSSYRPKTDGSMTISFATQLLDEDQKMEVITHYQQFGWLGFVDSEDATYLEIPSEDPKREGKSQSQRLYAALYVFYSKKYPEGKDFDNWRHQYMEDIIDQVKEKIDAVSG